MADRADPRRRFQFRLRALVTPSSTPIQPLALKISLGIAFVAWIVFSVCAIRLDDRIALLVCMGGFPAVYALWLGMAWLMATACSTIDESFIWGPAKDWQLKMIQGPMVWFMNAVIIFLPSGVLVAGILGLSGVLPVH